MKMDNDIKEETISSLIKIKDERVGKDNSNYYYYNYITNQAILVEYKDTKEETSIIPILELFKTDNEVSYTKKLITTKIEKLEIKLVNSINEDTKNYIKQRIKILKYNLEFFKTNRTTLSRKIKIEKLLN